MTLGNSLLEVTPVKPPFLPSKSVFSINHPLFSANLPIEGSLSDYLISEKLDGVRGAWNGKQLFTRTGRRIITPSWFTQDFPDYPLEGELWMGRETFEQMSGLVRRTTPLDEEWKKVKFMVFDFPSSELTFELRYQKFAKDLANISPYIVVIEQKRISSLTELDIWFEQVVKQGGEGLMLHRQTSLYIAGKNKDVIKFKPLFDAEAMVIGHIPGKGKFTGILGALLVETPEGLRFKIGTGFTLAERRQPPRLGAMVTYQFSGLTQKGTPRFARFLRVRLSE
ncbi:DNA ligase [Shewanella sp. VB17]|nr:DNA ligase [Shewanella sp. VB17]